MYVVLCTCVMKTKNELFIEKKLYMLSWHDEKQNSFFREKPRNACQPLIAIYSTELRKLFLAPDVLDQWLQGNTGWVRQFQYCKILVFGVALRSYLI